MELLEKPPPPHALPQRAFSLPTPGEFRMPCLLLRPVLNNNSNFFSTTFASPLPHALITLLHPTSQSFASTTPRSTIEPFPSTKLRSGCEGPTLSGAWGRSPVTPWGGSGRGPVRRGGSLEMKREHPQPLQRNGAIESGVGDVRDMNVSLDGGMERGHAPILPPPGVSQVLGEGGKAMVKW